MPAHDAIAKKQNMQTKSILKRFEYVRGFGEEVVGKVENKRNFLDFTSK